jgi:hypothetical protein
MTLEKYESSSSPLQTQLPNQNLASKRLED